MIQQKFPSPFGVRVLKWNTNYFIWTFIFTKFPSPFGVRVLKLAAEKLKELKAAAFPSPFGVRVLKLAAKLDKWREYALVSVPFRGSCSEMTCQVTWFVL